MAVDVYAMAKKYYPRLWDIERLNTLLEKGLLTKLQYDEIVGTATNG